MKRHTLYSKPADKPPGEDSALLQPRDESADRAQASPATSLVFKVVSTLVRAHPVACLLFLAILVAAGSVVLDRQYSAPMLIVTQDDIDRAVRNSLEKKPLPSKAAKAYEAIRPSIVRVDGFDHPEGVGNLPAPLVPDDKKSYNFV